MPDGDAQEGGSHIDAKADGHPGRHDRMDRWHSLMAERPGSFEDRQHVLGQVRPGEVALVDLTQDRPAEWIEAQEWRATQEGT